MVNRCNVVECKYKKNVAVFKVPQKNPELKEKWLKFLNRKDLMFDEMYLYKGIVCFMIVGFNLTWCHSLPFIRTSASYGGLSPNDNNSLFVAYDILLEFVYVKIVFFLFFNQICNRFFPHMINRSIIFLLKIFLEKDSFRKKKSCSSSYPSTALQVVWRNLNKMDFYSVSFINSVKFVRKFVKILNQYLWSNLSWKRALEKFLVHRYRALWHTGSYNDVKYSIYLYFLPSKCDKSMHRVMHSCWFTISTLTKAKRSSWITAAHKD